MSTQQVQQEQHTSMCAAGHFALRAANQPVQQLQRLGWRRLQPRQLPRLIGAKGVLGCGVTHRGGKEVTKYRGACATSEALMAWQVCHAAHA